MPTPLLGQRVQVKQGAYLPHWTLENSIYHVVLRLRDSLPAAVVARLRSERESLVASSGRQDRNQAGLNIHQRNLFSEEIEAILDNGLGDCWLARDDMAVLTADALRYFDGARYALHAWCVMPNHVHVVVQPQEGHELPSIVRSWKSFVAREANRRRKSSEGFWPAEYYDHLIRSEEELGQTVRYVQANPSRAGLANWRWVWPALG